MLPHSTVVGMGASESRSHDAVYLDDLARHDDAELARALEAIRSELTARALARADVDALVADGFARGFASSAGLPVDPWLVDGLLVCAGAKVERSSMRHTCAFVRVDDAWVWDSPTLVTDVVRHLPGPRPVMRSISIVAAPEGTAVDLVSARTRTGPHELVGVRSFVVEGGRLELVSARTVRAVSHRPGQ